MDEYLTTADIKKFQYKINSDKTIAFQELAKLLENKKVLFEELGLLLEFQSSEINSTRITFYYIIKDLRNNVESTVHYERIRNPEFLDNFVTGLARAAGNYRRDPDNFNKRRTAT